jgi:hypothetical protein
MNLQAYDGPYAENYWPIGYSMSQEEGSKDTSANKSKSQWGDAIQHQKDRLIRHSISVSTKPKQNKTKNKKQLKTKQKQKNPQKTNKKKQTKKTKNKTNQKKKHHKTSKQANRKWKCLDKGEGEKNWKKWYIQQKQNNTVVLLNVHTCTMLWIFYSNGFTVAS